MSADAPRFPGRLAVQQRVLPAYRTAFFEALGELCAGGLTVLAGEPRPGEAINVAAALRGVDRVALKNRHWLSGALYLCQQPGLLPWLRDHPPDALILEANPRYPSNWRARAWARNRGLPVIGWGLGTPTQGGLERWARRRFLAGFDALIAYSTHGAEAYRQLGMAPERVFVAVNAVSPAPARLPARAPRGSGPLRVLYVGRLQPRKRLDVLIRACASLLPPAELVIAGDGPARRRLEAQAAQASAQVSFRGHLSGQALEDLYGWAEVFALPGTGGLAVQQAMAHGLPVIVGEGDGTAPDLVRPGNGWRVEPGDEAGLAAILNQAQADRPRLAAMGDESARVVAEEVNIQTMAATFVKAVTSLARRA